MEEIKFVVDPEKEGKRIDKVIADVLGKEYSRTYAKLLIDKELVKVNGEAVKPRHITHENDIVNITLPDPETHEALPEKIPIEILYEDEHIIVVNKSAGIVVHPGSGNRTGTLVNALLYHCKKLADTGDVLRPGIVHRLDKDTSGVIVIAKNEKALRSLSRQFHERTIKKTYVALVKGKVELDNGIIDVPIGRDKSDRKKMSIDLSGGKEAYTLYHVIKRYKGFTSIRLEPKTGRTHQIRVHMKHIGHPLLGDLKYGNPQGMERHALHAESLKFEHPVTGKLMEFEVPIPEDMKKAMEQ
ncbi:MAG: RluA family pseudouridine synthase [Candidatus Omnitrophota bacterium]